MKIRNAVIFAVLAFMSPFLWAQDNQDYLSYAIPKNAYKHEGVSRDPGERVLNYYISEELFKQKRFEESCISREIYYGKQLIERKLFKDTKEHGIQRRWHLNGQLRNESPYKEGVRHGVFREWDEKGQLIAQYEIWDGNGTSRIYNNSGELIEEREYKNNDLNGLSMTISNIQKIRCFVWRKDGRHVGVAFGFYSTDVLEGITCETMDGGALHGPHIEFSKNGIVTKKQWFVSNKEVAESEYATAAKKDPSLPPYYADASKYKEFVTDDVKALLKKYRELPLVKIPLEFDKNGNPVLASSSR